MEIILKLDIFLLSASGGQADGLWREAHCPLGGIHERTTKQTSRGGWRAQKSYGAPQRTVFWDGEGTDQICFFLRPFLFNSAGFVPILGCFWLKLRFFWKAETRRKKRRISSTGLVWEEKVANFQLKCLSVLVFFRAGGMPVFLHFFEGGTGNYVVWLHQLRDLQTGILSYLQRVLSHLGKQRLM